MANHGDAFGGEPGDDGKARRAVDAVAADAHDAVGGAQVVLVGAELAVEQTHLHEAAPGGGAHLRGPDRIDDREQVDAGGAGRRRLVGRVDIEHRQLGLALQGAEIGNGPSFRAHGPPPSVRRPCHSPARSLSMGEASLACRWQGQSLEPDGHLRPCGGVRCALLVRGRGESRRECPFRVAEAGGGESRRECPFPCCAGRRGESRRECPFPCCVGRRGESRRECPFPCCAGRPRREPARMSLSVLRRPTGREPARMSLSVLRRPTGREPARMSLSVLRRPTGGESRRECPSPCCGGRRGDTRRSSIDRPGVAGRGPRRPNPTASASPRAQP